MAACEGCKLAIVGVAVKVTALLGVPLTVTTRLPVVASAGTVVRIDESFQVSAVAAARLKKSVLEPCVAPKLLPVIVTCVPWVPAAGVTLPMEGTTVVKGT
jgi:hypothetical protein